MVQAQTFYGNSWINQAICADMERLSPTPQRGVTYNLENAYGRYIGQMHINQETAGSCNFGIQIRRPGDGQYEGAYARVFIGYLEAESIRYAGETHYLLKTQGTASFPFIQGSDVYHILFDKDGYFVGIKNFVVPGGLEKISSAILNPFTGYKFISSNQ